MLRMYVGPRAADAFSADNESAKVARVVMHSNSTWADIGSEVNYRWSELPLDLKECPAMFVDTGDAPLCKD